MKSYKEWETTAKSRMVNGTFLLRDQFSPWVPVYLMRNAPLLTTLLLIISIFVGILLAAL